jgi:hypothetical protein
MRLLASCGGLYVIDAMVQLGLASVYASEERRGIHARENNQA